MYCLNVSVHPVQSTSSSMTIHPCTADEQIEGRNNSVYDIVF